MRQGITEMTNAEIDRIVQTLESGGEQNKYYVYMLCRGNGQPFYVGKGQGRRVFEHEKEAKDRFAEIDADKDLTEEEKVLKRNEVYEKLRIIGEEGDNIKRIIVKWGLRSQEAYMCESALINVFGFLNERSMINKLSNRVNGMASAVEKACPSDVKTCARDASQFLAECAIEEKSVEDLRENIAFIKLGDDFYLQCLEEHRVDNERIKDAVRGVWRIEERRRRMLQYVFALYRRRVVGVFRVTNVSRPVGIVFKSGEVKNYPTFPLKEREAERLVMPYATLNEARMSLGDEVYGKVDAFLTKVLKSKRLGTTKEAVFADLRKRVFFELDDQVPSHLIAYKGCIVPNVVRHSGRSVMLEGRGCQSSVVYNFDC